MAIHYQEWCANNINITPLIRKMKSSLPEQYIGYYLNKAFASEIEYQRQFPWLGNYSLDIYIPSLCLTIEYDGVYYHSKRKAADDYKTSLCRSNGIYLIRVLELEAKHPKNRKHNVINYYYHKNYRNIGIAISALFEKINEKYGIELKSDVDLIRDWDDIIAYVQYKFYRKSLACVWPEIEFYWDDEANILTYYDVLQTNGDVYWLKCPHCGKNTHYICGMSMKENPWYLVIVNTKVWRMILAKHSEYIAKQGKLCRSTTLFEAADCTTEWLWLLQKYGGVSQERKRRYIKKSDLIPDISMLIWSCASNRMYMNPVRRNDVKTCAVPLYKCDWE